MVMAKRLTRFVVYLAPVGFMAVALVWFLMAADPPATAQQVGPPASNQVLKVYPCTPGSARAIATQLRELYRAVPGVRVGADDRLGQVLVEAPPAIQAQISQRLKLPAPALGPQSPRVASAAPQTVPPAAARGPRSRTLQLRHTTAQQLEAALVKTLGGRLTPIVGGGQAAREYRLDLPGGGKINLGVHYQTNLAVVQGAGRAVESCVRLIQALDRPRSSAGQSTRLISLQTSSPASVRRVVSAVGAGTPNRPRGQLATTLFQQPAAGEEEDPKAPPPGTPAAPNGVPPVTNGQGPQGILLGAYP